MNLSNLLQTGLQDLHLSLSEAVQIQLLDYVHLLSKWNRIYNLTAIRDEAQMIPKHLLDSLAVLPYICSTQILDVGTGAGLPGLLLAIARPDWQCVLLDSNAKKIRFLRQVLVELKITNVEVVHSRIEDYQPGPTKSFTTIISRAYTRLSDFYQQTVKLCATDGCLVAMKGSYPDLEIEELKELPVHLEVVPLLIPQLEAQRHLVVIHG